MSKLKIDMGGFDSHEEIEVFFAGKTYMVKLDPPIEVWRMLMSISGLKFDNEETIEKLKNITTNVICLNNPGVDKKEFKESLTTISAMSFVTQYDKLLGKGGGQKKDESEQNQNLKDQEDDQKEVPAPK